MATSCSADLRRTGSSGSSLSLLSNSNTCNANHPSLHTVTGAGIDLGVSTLESSRSLGVFQRVPLHSSVQSISPQTSSTSSSSSSSGDSSGFRNEDDSSDEMEAEEEQTEPSKPGLGSLEPEVVSLHRMTLPQALPIAGDLPAHAIPTVTSPSLGFSLPSSSEPEGSGMPHLPDRPSPAQYHPRLGLQTLVRAHDQDSPPLSSSPTLFSAQQGILHPIFTAQGLTATFARGHSPPHHEPEVQEAQVCLWNNCNREFPSLAVLVSHLDRDHTLSMDKYVCLWRDCPRAQKPFDARYKLITHLRCHTGEKPYRCEVTQCARSFSRLENLKLHVRTHTGEKPYTCHYDGCNKRFNNTSDRAKHMKTHITRKPYACKYPGCGKSYTDPSSMRKHVKFAHKLREKDSGDLGGSAGGVSTPRQSSRKQSSSSSCSSPGTPHTPTTGITMIVPRPLTSPTPLTLGNTIIPTSPNQTPFPQTTLYLPSSVVPPADSLGGVVTMVPPTSSLVTVPVSAPVQPQMVVSPKAQPLILQPGNAPQLSRGQPVVLQSGSAQQPVLMVLPGGTTGTSNGSVAPSYVGVGLNNGGPQSSGLKVNTRSSPTQSQLQQPGVAEPVTARTQRGGSERTQPQPSNRNVAQDASEGDGELTRLVRNSQVTVEGGDDGNTIEEELRRKIAHLQHQLRLHQSKKGRTDDSQTSEISQTIHSSQASLTSQTSETSQTSQSRSNPNLPANAERNNTVTTSANTALLPCVTLPSHTQLTPPTAQLIGGASPSKVSIVTTSSPRPSPHVHRQIVALPANGSQLSMAAIQPTTGNLVPTQYYHPASGTRISVLQPSSSRQSPGNSPAGIVMNSSHQVLGDQTVVPQIMLMQTPGVVAPQILQLAPALHGNTTKTLL